MPTQLPEMSAGQFHSALESALGSPLSGSLVARLLLHYRELRRWAARTALVGAAETERMLERHYAESLLALPLVGQASRILDLGSGAGFPGWVLAAALPAARVWLVESRERKVAFLRAAAARAELSCTITGARVSRRQPVTTFLDAAGRAPGAIDVVTIRAVKITDDLWAGLRLGLADGARVVRWEGTEPVEPVPGAVTNRSVSLPGRSGRIREWVVGNGGEGGPGSDEEHET